MASGPGEFSGLPELILAVDINEGERVITATSITAQEVDSADLRKPKKGKEVTAEEYHQIVREKTKEIRESRADAGHGGAVIMRQ